MKKYLLFAVIAIALGACSSKYSAAKFDANKFAADKMAIVVIGSEHNAKSSRFDVGAFMDFENDNGKEINLMINEKPGINYFMVPMGHYKLVDYSLQGSRQDGNVKSYINMPFAGAINAEFDVRAGDAVYLGTVVTKITRAEKNLLKSMFGFGMSQNDFDFTTVVEDRFDKIDRATIESETGTKLNKKIMKWEKITSDLEQ